MAEAEVLDILRQALWVALVVSTPILAVALVVGLAIGLVQALTSVQEMGRMADVDTPFIDSLLALTQQMARVRGLYPTFPETTGAAAETAGAA